MAERSNGRERSLRVGAIVALGLAVGFVVWLVAAPGVLADRLRADRVDRPALTAAGTLAEIAEVLAARTPWYRDVAHVMIETDGRTAAEVADAVLEAWARLDRAGGGAR